MTSTVPICTHDQPGGAAGAAEALGEFRQEELQRLRGAGRRKGHNGPVSEGIIAVV